MHGLKQHHRLRRAGGASASVGDRLALAYRQEGFAVRAAPLPADGPQQPDAALLLSRGGQTVLVHAYGSVHGAQAQAAVQKLATDGFTQGATRGELIAAAGFTVAAYQAALRLGQITLCEDAARAALLDAPVEDTPVAMPARTPGRPALALRAAISCGGAAMALVLVLAAMPGLRGQMQDLLHRPASAPAMATPIAASDWVAPAGSRSGALELGGTLAPSVAQAQSMTAPLPANFNQALAARL